MEPVVIMIVAEGNSPEMAYWYIRDLKEHYRAMRGEEGEPRVLTFRHDGSPQALQLGVRMSTRAQVLKFIEENEFETAEIHAQGGLGAYVAYEFLRHYEIQGRPEHRGRKITLTDVFIVGGAPSDAMTGVARWFHQDFSRFWYRIRWIVPFFADDPPNSECNDEINRIRKASKQVMRSNSKLYRDQLVFIGNWRIPSDWRVPENCRVWYVPNGESARFQSRSGRDARDGKIARWMKRMGARLTRTWDNTYDDAKARACWEAHGARVTERPGRNFSFYSMMPATALFERMDEVR